MKPITATTIVASSLLIFTGCKSKETLPINTLMAGVDMQVLGYTQKFTKDTTDFYNLSATSSFMGLRLSGNFMQENVTMEKDSTLPDPKKGYYSKIRFISPDTLEQNYKSPVAGQDMESNLKCAITFEKGTASELLAGKMTTLDYTEAGKAELQAMYTTQLEREFTPMITDMMWQEIERINKDKFTSSEVRERYRLNVQTKTDIVEMGKSTITIDGNSAEITYKERLYFRVKFNGKIDILK